MKIAEFELNDVQHKSILGLVSKAVRKAEMPMESMSRRKIVEILHRTLIAECVTHNEFMNNDINIFTDGFIMNERAGVGVYSAVLDLSCRLGLAQI